MRAVAAGRHGARRWSRARTAPVWRGVAGAAVVAVGLAGGAARALPIEEPLPGAFVPGPDLAVRGAIPTSDVTGTSASLDGAPLVLTPGDVLPDGRVEALFDTLVPLDPSAVLQSVLLRFTLPDQSVGRERVTVVVGASTPDGVASPESAALRVTDAGLAAFAPAIASLVDFDLATLLPVGLRIYNKCLVDTFAGCIGRAKVYVDDPPPSFSDQDVALDSELAGVRLALALHEVRIDLDIRGSGVVPDCRLRLTADAVRIGALHALSPDATSPTRLDLVQSGPVDVDFDRFRQNFTGGSCNDPLIEDVIDAIVGDLEGDIRDALQELLEDPDGSGPEDGPLAEVIEDALGDVEITRPIAEALEVSLWSPLAAVEVDADGVSFVTDTAVQALVDLPDGCDAPPGSLDLEASYEPAASLPALGSVTPQGGLVFDAALALSDAALDQGLKAFTECGLLHSDLEELTLAGTTLPVNAQLLSLIEPAFGSLPSSLPLVIRIRPRVAPILAPGAGPQGELAALRIADLRLAVIDPADDFVWLELAVDATTGLDFAFDPGSGDLDLATAGALADVRIVVLDNAIGADEPELGQALADLLETGTLSLSNELGRFRLPPFLGLELRPVEIARTAGGAAFFFEATPVPEPGMGAATAVGVVTILALRRRASRRG